MRIKIKGYNNLFPLPRRNRAGFTKEEMQDILRFAQAHGIAGVARVQLFARIRDVRSARAVQKHNRSVGLKAEV